MTLQREARIEPRIDFAILPAATSLLYSNAASLFLVSSCQEKLKTISFDCNNSNTKLELLTSKAICRYAAFGNQAIFLVNSKPDQTCASIPFPNLQW
jgi:hypothetical protein